MVTITKHPATQSQSFVQSTTPGDSESPQGAIAVGDDWRDTSATPVLKICTSISPITFASVAAGGGISNVVEDTTPQLGGNLDANGNNVQFDDATGIQDDSGNEQLTFQKTTTAVNNIEITNAAAGSGASLGSVGDDTDVDLLLTAQGAGVVKADGSQVMTQGDNAAASEINTGTSTAKFNTPDALAGSIFGRIRVQVIAFDFTTDVAVGDGAFYFTVHSDLNGMNLVAVHAQVRTPGTTGTTDIQIHNVTQAADMLSTKLTIDSGEDGSDTALTPAVIDTANDDVASWDELRIDVDAISTTAPKGLTITMVFQLP